MSERVAGTVQQIRFDGEGWIMTKGNAITTPDDYRDFAESYAHYFPIEGVIRRYGNQIGTTEDIWFGEVVEHDGPTVEGFIANAFDWSRPAP